MINEVMLEGVIVQAWKCADDLLFSLACYRDSDLPQKSFNETQDTAGFVTIQVLKKRDMLHTQTGVRRTLFWQLWEREIAG